MDRASMNRDGPENRAPVDTSGPIRIEQVGGNWYVVSGDVLMPVKDKHEAKTLVARLTDQGSSERPATDET
ncbi:MAG: hypothetical protein JSW71_09020 [Gemmatimonadota bacterium]|nr:MAG: hypothetical protein JSW71_09020 [Gemmatimonadota bacterium]